MKTLNIRETKDAVKSEICPKCRAVPFFTKDWNVIMVNPPLIINEEQLEEGFRIIDQALEITDAAMTDQVYISTSTYILNRLKT